MDPRFFATSAVAVPLLRDGGPNWRFVWDDYLEAANFKESTHSLFIQIADMVSYAAFMKEKAESGALEDWQARLGLGSLYDAIPQRVLNTKASTADPQGIVRLGS
ncbi:MAG: hypothetical protein A2Y95_10185 [Deltaproteobacteria bacterium RBG_13_65_10]|nr:MAG: hypothetical protein A2Y95_10185 [Deltaproteobacteria bacterium RBG_13_65_10]